MDDLALARALHVLAVVIWIGGVSMVSTVAIPAIRRGDLGADPVRAFHAIERRFIWQARAAVLLVGLSGFYMTAEMDLWDRFLSVEFWWMHAMVGVWLLFTLILFVVEPFVLHSRFDGWTKTAPEAVLLWLQCGHWILLGLGLLTVLGAAAGSHGWIFF